MSTLLEVIDELPQELRLPLLKAFEYFRQEIADTVKKSDFEELKAVVRELVEAQKASEQRLTKLEVTVGELAEAQKRTEQRVEELAEAQKRTEQRVEELVLAQKETQKEVSRLDRALQELAEAQKRTEQRLEELAEAQKRTEQRVEELALALKDTRQMVGNLSDTVGYSLEDRAMKALPEVLLEKFNIKVKGKLIRKYVQYNGKYNEINIYGEGEKEGKNITIVGEAKARLSKNNVDSLLKLIDRLKRKGIITEEVFPLIVTYTATPEAEQYSLSKGIHVIWSYEV